MLPETNEPKHPLITLRPWSAEDFPLLIASNSPEMTQFLGGPEGEEKLRRRHERYLNGWVTGSAHMFHVESTEITDAPGGVGIAGYWQSEWQGEDCFESGWSINPPHQGRGYATAAVQAVLRHAAEARRFRRIHAFPKLDNAASNRVCLRAGFTLVGECDFEYPLGTMIRGNDWVYELY